MNGFLIFYLIVLIFGNAGCCGWLADRKGYSTTLWTVLGVLFPGIAILAMVGAPNLLETK
jgi:hypothetical protein